VAVQGFNFTAEVIVRDLDSMYKGSVSQDYPVASCFLLFVF